MTVSDPTTIQNCFRETSFRYSGIPEVFTNFEDELSLLIFIEISKMMHETRKNNMQG